MARYQLAAADTPKLRTAAIDAVALALEAFELVATSLVPHQFQAQLVPNQLIALPGNPARFDIALENQGNSPTTYQLSVNGLPEGVEGTFSRSTITLQPGEFVNGNLTGAKMKRLSALPMMS
ncbi:MAG: hypothetical protein R3C10_26240 [Pirellulales bacterium]